MVALLVNILHCFRSALVRNVETLARHPLDIPLPSVFHRTLDNQFVDSFEDVLVIGDIHGCYDELVECLAFQNSEHTLKLFVGDLVNKGPKNIEVLDYLMTKGNGTCFAVRGNHDEVVIKEYLMHKSGHSISERNEWIKNLSEEHIEFLISLPYTITVPSLNAIIVHAGLVPGKALQSMDLADFVTMRNIVCTDYFDGEGIKASKTENVGEPWAQNWPGPLHVYFGHDAKRKLQRHAFATGLDTGCVYGNLLTAVFIKGPRKNQFLSIKAKKVYQDVKGMRI